MRILLSLSSVAAVLSLSWGQDTRGRRPTAGIEESRSLMDYDRIELGRVLFNDPILSSNGKVSCATCHDFTRGYSSPGLPPSLSGGVLSRRAPGIMDRSLSASFFWDGRAKSLVEQAKEVITNRDEMGNKTVSEATTRVNKKFDLRLTDTEMVNAIVAYEETLKSPANRLDGYLRGENKLTLTASEARGWELFRGDAQCYKCHTGKLFTDDKLHDTGLGGKFKTPGLRQCGKFGGWGHDARFNTLEEVVEHYSRGGGEAKRLNLTKEQKADLVALLRSL